MIMHSEFEKFKRQRAKFQVAQQVQRVPLWSGLLARQRHTNTIRHEQRHWILCV